MFLSELATGTITAHTRFTHLWMCLLDPGVWSCSSLTSVGLLDLATPDQSRISHENISLERQDIFSLQVEAFGRKEIPVHGRGIPNKPLKKTLPGYGIPSLPCGG